MPTSLLLKGVSLVASLSVGKVVTDVVKNNVASTGAVTKTAHWVGSFVLGAMAMDHASKFVDDRLETFVKEIEEQKKEAENELESSTETEGP